MDVSRLLLLLAVLLDVEIYHEVKAFNYSTTVRSEHSKGLLEPLNISLKDSSIQNERGGTLPFEDSSIQPAGEGSNSLDTPIQPEREVPVSLEKNYMESQDVGLMLFENSTTKPEREDRKPEKNEDRSETQMLTDNSSSLYQYPVLSSAAKPLNHTFATLNNTAMDHIVQNTSAGNIIRNFSVQYVHNISGIDNQEVSNDVSSARTTASILASQTFESTTRFANLQDVETLLPYSLSTSNNDIRVLHDPVISNGSYLDPNMSYSTKTLTSDSSGNLTDDLEPVAEATNNTMYTVIPNSSGHYLKLHTRKLPEGEPISGKLHKIPDDPKIFSSSIFHTTKNEAYTSETDATVFSTTSLPLFNWSVDAIITTHSSVTTDSTASRIVPETTTEKSVFVEDFPEKSPMSFPTSGTPAPFTSSSSYISSIKIQESGATHVASTSPSVETASSTTLSTVLSIDNIISSPISDNVPSVETVTSSTISTTFPISVSSVNVLPANETGQKKELQIDDINSKNGSSLKGGKSLTSLSDNSITTSVNVAHEKSFFKSEKLTETQKKEDPLTIIFKCGIEVAQWFLLHDMDFRKYFSKALTVYQVIQGKWNKTFSPEDIRYVIPGPFANRENFTICILVKDPAVEEQNMFVPGKYLQKCLKETTPDWKQTLNLTITDTFIGIPTPPQHYCEVQETTDDRTKITIAMILVIIIFMSIIAAIVLTMKCRQRHGFFEPPAGLSYRLPRRSPDKSCPSDGRHLATDEECTAMEGSNAPLSEVKEEKANGSTASTSKAPENVTMMISKEEHEKELEGCFSGRGDLQKTENFNNMESNEEIVMVLLHKPPLASEA